MREGPRTSPFIVLQVRLTALKVSRRLGPGQPIAQHLAAQRRRRRRGFAQRSYVHACMRQFERMPDEPTLESGSRCFEVKLQPTASQNFPIIEEQVLNNDLAVSNQNIDSILDFERNKALTDAGRRSIEQ